MSEHTEVYQFARITGTIGAGIFTGLALSAPIYSLPSISAFSPSKSISSRSYSTNGKGDLSISDRLKLFRTIHETTGAVSIPFAIISAMSFGLAAYVSPPSIAYNATYLARGAGEIGTRYPSDRLLTRLTAPRALLVGSALALFSVIPISSFISQTAARGALQLETRLVADASLGLPAPGTVSEPEKQLERQLAKWTMGTQLAALVGLIATLAGSMQLAGHVL